MIYLPIQMENRKKLQLMLRRFRKCATASDFSTLREFGVLTALTMAICLVTDVVLLPALLVLLARRFDGVGTAGEPVPAQA